VEDADEEDEANAKLMVSDIPFDIEEGDRVWVTGLILEAQYIQASSTISQQLVEGFAKKTKANPTLLTGGSSSKDPIPDYIKILDKSFQKKDLLNSQTTNHGITQSN